jgi:hypothetical protein
MTSFEDYLAGHFRQGGRTPFRRKSILGLDLVPVAFFDNISSGSPLAGERRHEVQQERAGDSVAIAPVRLPAIRESSGPDLS